MRPQARSEQEVAAIRAAYDRARQVMQAGDLDEAELQCRGAIPRFGRDPNLLCLLGEILIRQRKPQEGGFRSNS